MRRPVHLEQFLRDGGHLRVSTSVGQWRASRVISATGTWRQPFWPIYPGARTFGWQQLHTVHYRDAEPFVGKHVVAVAVAPRSCRLHPVEGLFA